MYPADPRFEFNPLDSKVTFAQLLEWMQALPPEQLKERVYVRFDSDGSDHPVTGLFLPDDTTKVPYMTVDSF